MAAVVKALEAASPWGDALPIAAVSDATVASTLSAAMVISPISAASAGPNFSPVRK